MKKKRVFLIIFIFVFLINFYGTMPYKKVKAEVPTVTYPLISGSSDKSKLILITALLLAMGIQAKQQCDMYVQGKIFQRMKDNADNFKTVASKSAGDVVTLTSKGLENLKTAFNDVTSETALDTGFIQKSGLFIEDANGTTLSNVSGGWLVSGVYTISCSNTVKKTSDSTLEDVVGWRWKQVGTYSDGSGMYYLVIKTVSGLEYNLFSPYGFRGTESVTCKPLKGGSSVCVAPPMTFKGSFNPSIDATKEVAVPVSSVDAGTLGYSDVINHPYADDVAKKVAMPTDIASTPAANPTDTPTTTTGFWDTLWKWLQNILDAIKSIPTVLGNILDFIKSIPANIVGAITGLWDWLKDLVAGDLAGSVDGLLDGVKKHFKVDRMSKSWEALKSMDTSKGSPPKFKMPLHDIFSAASGRFGVSNNPFNNDSDFIDFSIFDKLTFGGFSLIDYFRTIFGFGFVITTFLYVWHKIMPKSAIGGD